MQSVLLCPCYAHRSPVAHVEETNSYVSESSINLDVTVDLTEAFHSEVSSTAEESNIFKGINLKSCTASHIFTNVIAFCCSFHDLIVAGEKIIYEFSCSPGYCECFLYILCTIVTKAWGRISYSSSSTSVRHLFLPCVYCTIDLPEEEEDERKKSNQCYLKRWAEKWTHWRETEKGEGLLVPCVVTVTQC